MKHDAAEEAALGLLGLHALSSAATNASSDHNHHHQQQLQQQQQHRTTPTIPLKRKSSAYSQPNTPLDRHPRPRPPATTSPGKDSTNSDAIRCICGYDYDDGFSVACDQCGRWVHAACFDIVDSQVPEVFKCLECEPRSVNRERAIRLQKLKQKSIQDVELEKQRRRASPGVERKGRKTSASTTTAQPSNDGSHPAPQPAKRKRRASMINAPPHTTEDELVDIDEPSTHSYLHMDHDEIPHQHTRDRLKRLAQDWRGVTALDNDDPTSPVVLTPNDIPLHPHATLRPVPPSSLSHSTLSLHSNPSVRPPTYAVHTTKPIPSKSLIAPYVSTIVPSSHYLADPLNAYAHLSMPKPFVHLLGPPLDVALDARTTGQEGRFVRNGCRPNAVLRPVLCNKGRDGSDEWVENLTFGVFALRDLRANEEVVLGWEWDDGSVIHQLPALISNPHLFAPFRLEQFRNQMTSMLHAISSTFATCACGTRVRDCALTRLAEFVDGHTHLHSHHSQPQSHSIPPSPYPQPDLGPLIGQERGFRTRERNPRSGGMGGVEMAYDDSRSYAHAESYRSANGVENRRYEQWLDSPGAGPSSLPLGVVDPNRESNRQERERMVGGKGKVKATDIGSERERTLSKSSPDLSPSHQTQHLHQLQHRGPANTNSPLVPTPTSTSKGTLNRPDRLPSDEDKLPPKLRKAWIRRKASALQSRYGTPQRQEQEQQERVLREQREYQERRKADVEDDTRMVVDDSDSMPPPPLPSSILATGQSASRSTSPPPSSSQPLHSTPNPVPIRSPSPPQRPSRPSASTSCSISSLVDPTPPYPTTPFANMSIHSPAVPNTSSYFSPSLSSTSSPSNFNSNIPDVLSDLGTNSISRVRASSDSNSITFNSKSKLSEVEPLVVSIPPDVKAASHTTTLSQESGGSGLVDNNVSSGERRRRGGSTSAGVLRIADLLRSPIMENVPELKEVEKEVEKEEAVVMPCPEIEPVSQEEPVVAQDAEMVAEPVQVEAEVEVPESEEHQELANEMDVDMANVDTAPRSSSPVSSPIPPPLALDVVSIDTQMLPQVETLDDTPAPEAQAQVVTVDNMAVDKEPEQEPSSTTLDNVSLPEPVSAPSPEQPAPSTIIVSPPIDLPSSPAAETASIDVPLVDVTPMSTTSPIIPLLTPVNGLSSHLSDRDDLESTAKSTPAATPSPSTSLAPLPSHIAQQSQPQKVKLSLKDFAMRKKQRQKEEGEAKPAPPPPPPVSTTTSNEESKDGLKTEVTQDTRQEPGSSIDASKDVQIKELASIVDISAGLQDSVTSDQSPFVPEVILPSVEVHLARSLSPKEPLINGNIVEEPVGISLQTKIELTEEPKDLLLDRRQSTPLRAPTLADARSTRVHDRVSPPQSSTLLQVSSVPLVRQHSQEDGEILSPPPPKPPPLGPRPHTPPTHPRSYQPPSGNASPNSHHRTPPSVSRRPNTYRSSYNNSVSRPLPSAPRALRTGAAARTYRSYSSLDAPRGPSADRDRDWDRDRDSRSYRPGRGRGSGWSR